MSYKHDIIKERFDIKIENNDQVTKAAWELDKNANLLYGLLLTSDREDLLYYRGSQKIRLNDQELFPEDFESKLLMTGLAVSPNDRMVKVGLIETGNGRIEVSFKDQTHPKVKFTPYTVSFYFFSKVLCK